MRAGLMRSKLVFEHAGEEIDTNRQPLDTPWTAYYTCWGFVQPVAVEETVSNNQRIATTKVNITIRYYAGILPTDRVLYEGKYLEILSIIDLDSRKREMNLTAAAVMVVV